MQAVRGELADVEGGDAVAVRLLTWNGRRSGKTQVVLFEHAVCPVARAYQRAGWHFHKAFLKA